MKKPKKIVQIIIFIAFFTVPIFDIFRLDLIRSSFYLFRSEFPLQKAILYLLSVLLLVFIFVGIAKWSERKFCSWICPHNTLISYMFKLQSIPFLRKNQLRSKMIMAILSLTVSMFVAFALLAYFINPYFLFITIISLNLFTIAGNFFLFLTVIFFFLINKFKQHFCKHACPYGHFQKIFIDKTKTLNKRIFSGVNLLIFSVIITLLISLAIVSTQNNSFYVFVTEKVNGIQLNEKKVFAYELELNNFSKNDDYFSLEIDVPQNWEVILEERIFIEGKTNKKFPLTLLVPESDFNGYYLIHMNIKEETTNRSHETRFALQT